MIKGVIFDVDGVLLNSMPVWENLGELYLNSLGLEAEKDLGEILFTMSLEEGAEYLITQYGIDKSVEEVVNGLNREVQDFYAEKVPLKEGVRQYLSEFRERGIPMVIATSDFLIFEESTLVQRSGSAKISRISILPRRSSLILNRERPGCLRMRFTL